MTICACFESGGFFAGIEAVHWLGARGRLGLTA